MPADNKKLTLEQRITAVEWEAQAEKLSHFLRGTPGHPTFEARQVPELFDDVEAALTHLRRAFELMPPSSPDPAPASREDQVPPG